eukprot:CAMPEP_0116898362 /NCGR_PEP_ID=MMETSP0467-20121206/7087_1 /TAXON_ID=283647 /ORGANISM="Mesodinium pulex, Strain SPMC105" /LENGTH=40 /DNA_ID= /DNA_START= /DNA_END= /DNA_ORIENTATION=
MHENTHNFSDDKNSDSSNKNNMNFSAFDSNSNSLVKAKPK